MFILPHHTIPYPTLSCPALNKHRPPCSRLARSPMHRRTRGYITLKKPTLTVYKKNKRQKNEKFPSRAAKMAVRGSTYQPSPPPALPPPPTLPTFLSYPSADRKIRTTVSVTVPCYVHSRWSVYTPVLMLMQKMKPEQKILGCHVQAVPPAPQLSPFPTTI